jgi:hypothetical protein
MKFELGLFDNPYTDPSQPSKVYHTKENQDFALQVYNNIFLFIYLINYFKNKKIYF